MTSSTDGGLYDLFLVEDGNGEEEGEEGVVLVDGNCLRLVRAVLFCRVVCVRRWMCCLCFVF